MKIQSPGKLKQIVESSVSRVKEMDEDGFVVDEALEELAAFSASLSEGEARETGDVDLWEYKTENFEKGLELGAQLASGKKKAFSLYLEGETYDHAQYWFIADSAKELCERVKARLDALEEEIRQKKGLLPFNRK